MELSRVGIWQYSLLHRLLESCLQYEIYLPPTHTHSCVITQGSVDCAELTGQVAAAGQLQHAPTLVWGHVNQRWSHCLQVCFVCTIAGVVGVALAFFISVRLLACAPHNTTASSHVPRERGPAGVGSGMNRFLCFEQVCGRA